MRRKVTAWAVAVVQRPWFYFLLALVLALPPFFLTTIPPVDVATRYAPMAEAFARGDWGYAFHPRVPLLQSVIGGIAVFLTGCDGFSGVKFVSVMSYALAVFPLFLLFRKIFSLRTACLGVVFYLFCHLLLQYAGEGLRDNGKTLSLALAAWGLLSLWESPRKLRGYLWLGAAIGLGFLFRTELLVVGAFLLLAAAVRECLRKQIPWRSVLGGVITLLLLIPTIAVNHGFTGYPVPDVRVAQWLQQHRTQPEPVPVAPPEVKRPAVPAESGQSAPAVRRQEHFVEAGAPAVERKNLGVGEYLGDFFRGFYPPFLLPVLLGIGWRFVRRRWSAGETLLLCIVIGNAVVTALLILIGERYLYISRRYLLPAAPLLFGWSGYFAVSLWDFCRARWPKWFPAGSAVLIFAVCGGILYGAALSPVIRNFTSKKRRARTGAIFTCAETLRRDYLGARFGARSFLLSDYRSNRRPFVVVPDALEIAPMLAGGSRVFDRRIADYQVLNFGEQPPSRQWREVGEVRGYREDERYVIWKTLPVDPGEGRR